MNTRLLNILLAVSESFDYRSRIHRLYRRSNQIRVCNREGRGPLETDDHGFSKEEETESLAPDYKPGERVRGRVSAVYEKKVRVDLEKGGAGFIDLSHLSWKKILDPREVVYPGQAIEPQVIQMHKDARGRLQIDLSLLNPDDFPSCKYSSGKILDVDVVHVQQDFALCELEPGIAGILGPSNVRHHPIEDMRELFETGERIKARIVYMRLNPIDPKSPAKMDLSVKNSFKASVPIPEDMVGVVIGKGGQTIQKLKVESDCGIRVDGDRCCAEIVSWRQENIERAAELIRKLTERKVAVKPEMRTGSEKENIKTSSAAPHQVRRLVKIPVGTIGRLIGKKASMIKQIREIADAAIWCEENGLVKISGRRERNVRKAIDLIRRLIPEMEEAD
jgi:polyribonucleotide nucleotidyltransferase